MKVKILKPFHNSATERDLVPGDTEDLREKLAKALEADKYVRLLTEAELAAEAASAKAGGAPAAGHADDDDGDPAPDTAAEDVAAEAAEAATKKAAKKP